MIILGVTNTGDSGAALIVDGKVVAAANEERFVRKKLVRCFPAESIRWVLENQGLTVADVDAVAAGCWKGIDQSTTLPVLVRDIADQAQQGGDMAEVQQRVRVSASRDEMFRDEFYEGLIGLGFRPEQIQLYDHHYVHAVTAFYPSPFEDAYVLTADGRGDYRSVTLWEANRESGLRLVDVASELTSPGILYGMITKYLGFTPDRHEGKVTGLAAHGRPGPAYDLLRSVYRFDESEGRIRSFVGDHYRLFSTSESTKFGEAFAGLPREDVAWAVQRVLEEVLSGYLRHHLRGKAPRSVNLCLAGGCAANVKLNFELGELEPVKNVYVFPQMGDGGIGLGGAMAHAVAHDGARRFDLPTVYLGPEYNDEQIAGVLRAEGLEFRTVTDEERTRLVVEMLQADKIVGWYQGGMEFGPRALGHRTILGAATDAGINDTLNERLQRTEFMPFAPVMIDRDADACLEGWAPDQVSSQFMTICYRSKPLLAERCPAVVHVDGTVRPQVVFRDLNPAYYDVIRAYADATGNPALINTSFNHHEEPILNTPEDAVRSLRKGNVDVLVAGHHIVMP